MSGARVTWQGVGAEGQGMVLTHQHTSRTLPAEQDAERLAQPVIPRSPDLIGTVRNLPLCSERDSSPTGRDRNDKVVGGS